MKLILFFLSFFIFVTVSSGQIIADAGGKFFNCSSDSTNLTIGGAPSATNGIPPYSYSWSINPIIPFPGSPVIYHASDFLDDTTKANPEIIFYYSQFDSVNLFLNVSDSLGNHSSDTAKVVFSSYAFSIFQYYYVIAFGDSVYLNEGVNLDGGIGKLSYLWKPNHGLKDSTKMNGFWAKPDSSIIYTVTATDSLGCSATAPPYYKIIVYHIGLDEDALDKRIIVYPNPTNGLIHLRLEEGIEITKVSIATVLGQVVYANTHPETEFDISSFRKGIYILEIQTEKGIVRKKIEKL